MVGKTLGHYTILEPLGKGGMGEVYLGEDTRLGRKVAIKVLPQEYAGDPERLARFEQEARAAAALNHPHIAAVFDVGSEADTHFMVQEYLEGDTLGKRLDKGALPLDKALDLATEVGEALIAAHKAGIIHRDLKPDNIFVTEEGHAKVLDFGLAKLTETAAPAGSQASMSPTMLGTVAGQIMGTAGYMAPEQAQGDDEIDHRADLFAFGCVLYQMASGRQPFVGKNVLATLHQIANVEPPPLAAAGAQLPPELQRIVTKCLAKAAANRYQHGDDLVVDVRRLAHDVETGTARPLQAQSAGNERRTVPVGVAVALTAVALVSVLFGIRSSGRPAEAPSRSLAYLWMEVEADHWLWGGASLEPLYFGYKRPSRVAMIFSLDGSQVVYSATDGETSRLYRRDLNQPRAVAIPGTEGACCPFASPEGEWIGYYADGLKRIPASGGEPQMILAEPGNPWGASWGDDGNIVFSKGGILHRVSATGGRDEPLTELDAGASETIHRLPNVLPGSEAVILTVERGRGLDEADIVVHSLATRERKILIEGGNDGRYVPTGHLVFVRQGALWAVGFDLTELEVVGEEILVFEDVMHAAQGGSGDLNSGAGQFAFSRSGSLIYAAGGLYPRTLGALRWVDQQGNEEDLGAARDDYMYMRLSPDETQLAYRLLPGDGTSQTWVYDIERGTPRPLVLEGWSSFPVWSPDGSRIAFSWARGGEETVGSLWVMNANGTGEPERLTTSERTQSAADWSANGDLAFLEGGDIWVLSMEEGAQPRVLLETEFTEEHPVFSPNGDWLAYTSDQSGTHEVWVRPYPGPGADVRISVQSGKATSPAWSADGSRLFYRVFPLASTPLELAAGIPTMAVDITLGPPMQVGETRQLFETRHGDTSSVRSYDVGRDGRFVMLADYDQEPRPVTEMHFILNWFEWLKERVPTGG